MTASKYDYKLDPPERHYWCTRCDSQADYCERPEWHSKRDWIDAKCKEVEDAQDYAHDSAVDEGRAR